MTGPSLTRSGIVETLRERLGDVEFVRAAYLGGSDGTGRTDGWSDVDLVLLVEDDRVEDGFVAVHEIVEELSSIEHRYRLPSPTWHGHEQEFFRLRDADPCHFVDLVVMKKSAGDRLTERERHGEPLVLFDKDDLVHSTGLDREAHGKKMAARLPELRSMFPLFQCLVTKAVRRGHGPEAVYFYQALTVKPLVELLRMRHCPDRYDFGLRYLDRDLPADLRAEVEGLVLAGSLDELEEKRARAEALFERNLRELDEGVWAVGDAVSAPR